MSVFAHTLRVQPSFQFKNLREFYLLYDGALLLAVMLGSAALLAAGFEGLLPRFNPWLLLWLPLACHGVILCHMVVHNCTHGNLPRSINRLVGEICGLLILTRYASWEIIHRRHHKYSDDLERDPHPVVPSYWRFVWNSTVNVERQLQQQFLEWHGDTPENRRFERRRAYVSYGTGVFLLVFLHVLLGAGAFWMLFVPASICGYLHVNHFNWVTHNAMKPADGFRPVNLDEGAFFWLGNRIWWGIYFHKNHHDYSGLFNPMHLDRVRAQKARAREERLLADEAETQERLSAQARERAA